MSAPRTLEEKRDERDRLLRAYRINKRARWRELCEQEPRLPIFRRALRRTHDPRELIVRLSDSWLRNAPQDIRFAALQQIDEHSARMARMEGRASLDDPLPPETNAFFVSRQLLGVR